MTETNLTAFTLDELRAEAARTGRTFEELREIQREQIRWEGNADRRREAQRREEQRQAAEEEEGRQAAARLRQAKEEIANGKAGSAALALLNQLLDQRDAIQARHREEVSPLNERIASLLDKDAEEVADMGTPVLKREATASAYIGHLILRGVARTFAGGAKLLKEVTGKDWPVAHILSRPGKRATPRKPKD